MIRKLLPLLTLALAACAAAPGLQTHWPAHPEDSAWIEASLDRRLAESLGTLATLSARLGEETAPEDALAAAQEAAFAAAAMRALAHARAATAGTGPEARRALLFVAAAAACHEGVTRIAARIGATDGGISPEEALRRAQVACLSCQTLRMVG